MALDKEYFDAISIDLVKKKYYNANKVNAVLDDIRAQALAMTEELNTARVQLDALNSQKAEIGEAVMSAQQIYREIVEKANTRAADIVAEAERKRAALEKDNARLEEYAVKRVESCFAMAREQHLAAIEAINSEWQEFLCGLDSADADENGDETNAAALPRDIGDRLAAIASGIKDTLN